MKKIEKQSVTIWNLFSLQNAIITFLITGITFFFFEDVQWVRKILVIIVIWALYTFITDLIAHHLTYNNAAYELTDNILYIQNGGFSRHENTIPLNRIQHADIEQSFYSRFFDLYALNIYTAGANHTIEYIKREVADDLRNKITQINTKEMGLHE
ncbi:membrane protein YdbS with pleckstrin-like domain [Peribacillus deserti]|uniref:Membrane protein YdbS with pleckstrin-like domain n=1 Tax=Peribacillus deserti TaxID=673318 RepID=A0ABS2QL95_9BACI|nr:PH domain-containing protein [Peribacillus deserti]MBM7693539.1 membrane protein YdbS with pleckstrin-like domain [Peribacillus deserti]